MSQSHSTLYNTDDSSSSHESTNLNLHIPRQSRALIVDDDDDDDNYHDVDVDDDDDSIRNFGEFRNRPELQATNIMHVCACLLSVGSVYGGFYSEWNDNDFDSVVHDTYPVCSCS